jgi:hypothetical protein
MKAICNVCELAFDLTPVIFEPNGDSVMEKKEGAGFQLLPMHEPTPGKETTSVVSSETGQVLRRICNGSLRPPSITMR